MLINTAKNKKPWLFSFIALCFCICLCWESNWWRCFIHLLVLVFSVLWKLINRKSLIQFSDDVYISTPQEWLLFCVPGSGLVLRLFHGLTVKHRYIPCKRGVNDPHRQVSGYIGSGQDSCSGREEDGKDGEEGFIVSEVWTHVLHHYSSFTTDRQTDTGMNSSLVCSSSTDLNPCVTFLSFSVFIILPSCIYFGTGVYLYWNSTISLPFSLINLFCPRYTNSSSQHLKDKNVPIETY